MRNSATILTTLALGALVLGGSATVSLARGSEGHGVGASHDSMSAGSRAGVSDRMGGDRSIGRFDNGVNNRDKRDVAEAIGHRAGHDLGDDPWQSSPYYHGNQNSFLFGLFRR